MSEYREERRRDAAAEAEQRRKDAAAAEERRAERQRAADERAARLREQTRQEKEAERAARQKHRAERAARRAQALTPEQVYRRGTLALVAASAAASLPAQVLHFAGISTMLLPLPLSLEGAAWVAAAGVTLADERRLAGWVRWLLRGLVLAAAGFAATINYQYGAHLPSLTPAEASAAGAGLAAVSLLGPLFFEVRQWVLSLSAKAGDADAQALRRHTKRRRRHHRKVARIADRLLSAAPHGTLGVEDAWLRAWEIVHGTAEPGMTPDLHRRAVCSATAATAARRPQDTDVHTRIAAGLRPADWVLPTSADVVPLRPVKPQVASQMPPAADAPAKGVATRPAGARSTPPKRRKGDTPKYVRGARIQAAETARLTAPGTRIPTANGSAR